MYGGNTFVRLLKRLMYNISLHQRRYSSILMILVKRSNMVVELRTNIDQ